MKKKNDIILPERTTHQMRKQARDYMIPRGSFARSVHIQRIVELKTVQTKMPSTSIVFDENDKSEAYMRYICSRRKKYK